VESERDPFACPHCGSRYLPRTGWTVNSANQFVPTITCSGCGQLWASPTKPTVDSDLRTKLEALKRDVRMWMNTATHMMFAATDAEDRNRNDGKADAYAHVLAVLDALLADTSEQSTADN